MDDNRISDNLPELTREIAEAVMWNIRNGAVETGVSRSGDGIARIGDVDISKAMVDRLFDGNPDNPFMMAVTDYLTEKYGPPSERGYMHIAFGEGMAFMREAYRMAVEAEREEK
jgi:hypothetical protein